MFYEKTKFPFLTQHYAKHIKHKLLFRQNEKMEKSLKCGLY